MNLKVLKRLHEDFCFAIEEKYHLEDEIITPETFNQAEAKNISEESSTCFRIIKWREENELLNILDILKENAWV